MNRRHISGKCMQAIMQNEVGGEMALVYMFSDPDGVRNGKSGWSFGRVQFDTQNNFSALHCLEACGFTVHEVVKVIKQDGDVSYLNAKLRNKSDVVDRFDTAHVNKSLQHCEQLVDGYGIKLDSEGVMVHIVDYHNQFNLSKGGKLHKWLQDLSIPITADMMLEFKLKHTLWGQKRPDDVKRRWRNIENLLEE